MNEDIGCIQFEVSAFLSKHIDTYRVIMRKDDVKLQMVKTDTDRRERSSVLSFSFLAKLILYIERYAQGSCYTTPDVFRYIGLNTSDDWHQFHALGEPVGHDLSDEHRDKLYTQLVKELL